MFRFIRQYFGTLVRLLHARRSLLLENLALRQQWAALKRWHPRPRLDLLDKLFWVSVRRLWRGWQQSLIVVTPETVVCWHHSLRSRRFSRTTGRAAPPVRSGCLIRSSLADCENARIPPSY